MKRDEHPLIVTVGEDGVFGLAPQGCGTRVPAGTYEVAQLDGVSDERLYLRDPHSDELLACVSRDSVQVYDPRKDVDGVNCPNGAGCDLHVFGHNRSGTERWG